MFSATTTHCHHVGSGWDDPLLDPPREPRHDDDRSHPPVVNRTSPEMHPPSPRCERALQSERFVGELASSPQVLGESWGGGHLEHDEATAGGDC